MASNASIIAQTTPALARSVVYELLRQQLRPRFVSPSCGGFTGAVIAVQAGYKPYQISTSDTSLQSGVLGFVLDPAKSLADLDLTPTAELKEFTKGAHDDITRAAGILLCAKWLDSPTTSVYNCRFRDRLFKDRFNQRRELAEQIEKLAFLLTGIRFDFADPKKVLLGLDGDSAAYLTAPNNNWGQIETIDIFTRLTETKADIIALVPHRRYVVAGWEKVAGFDFARKGSPSFVIRNHAGNPKLTRGQISNAKADS